MLSRLNEIIKKENYLKGLQFNIFNSIKLFIKRCLRTRKYIIITKQSVKMVYIKYQTFFCSQILIFVK